MGKLLKLTIEVDDDNRDQVTALNDFGLKFVAKRELDFSHELDYDISDLTTAQWRQLTARLEDDPAVRTYRWTEDKTDRRIKTEATQAEYHRVFDNYNLPPRNIYAECSDGQWVRRAWEAGRRFGWDRWERSDR